MPIVRKDYRNGGSANDLTLIKVFLPVTGLE
jgi:hypothetical protein